MVGYVEPYPIPGASHAWRYRSFNPSHTEDGFPIYEDALRDFFEMAGIDPEVL